MARRYLAIPNATRRVTKLQHFAQGLDANLDEMVLPPNVASELFNFEFSTGALTEGYGLKEAMQIQREVVNIWTFFRFDTDTETTEEILMYSDTSGYVYYQRGNEEFLLEGVKFTNKPRAINYRLYGDDVILMTSASDNMMVWDGINEAYSVPNSPKITSMVIHFERMFSTVGGERNAVWFSRDLDPTNWDIELDRGGFIELLDERGKLNKVLSLHNHIYIFRDFGISRLTAFADQVDFQVTNMFVSSGKIYADTATLCGDRILFLASDGLYSFDGVSTQRILQRLDSLYMPSEAATGAFFDGKYYLALALKKNGSEYQNADEQAENNSVIVLDIQSGRFSILSGVSVMVFARKHNKLYAIINGGKAALVEKCGSVFGEPTIKSWTSGELDLGTERRKTIREIYLSTDSEINLTIETENGKREFTVQSEPSLSRVRVNLQGRTVRIAIKASTAEARVSRMSIVYS